MISREHHDSWIHIELILSPSYMMTRASKDKARQAKRNESPSHTRWAGKPAAEPEQNKNVYKYTTYLQIVLMFKDPLTSGSDWEGSPSSVVFNGIHECTKLMETRRLRPVVDTLRPVVKGAARTKFSHFPHRPHGVDGARKTKQGSISYKDVEAH